MTRPRKLLHAWAWMVCIAIVAVPTGGAHWHLCFDGYEPPVSLNLTIDTSGGTASLHAAGSGVRAQFHDVNVSLTGSALERQVAGVVSPPLLSTYIVVPLSTAAVLPIARDRLAPIPSVPIIRFRPPLRAPPI